MSDLYSTNELLRIRGKYILLFSGTVTANGNSHSNRKNVMPFKEGNFFLDVTAKAGTTPTLDVKVVSKDPNPLTDKWSQLFAFAQKTDVGQEMKTQVGNLGENLSIEYTVGGTTPSFTFTVYAIVKI